MKSSELNIFQYTSFRTYLNAYGEAKKRSNPRWSYGSWAKCLKLSGTASLTMILNGQRNPGPIVAKRLVQYFKFNKKESTYFQDLILLEKSQGDPRLSALIVERLERQSTNTNFIEVDQHQLRVISKWYYYAIREMIHLEDFREDPNWIAQKLNFKVTIPDIKRAIRDLVDLNLLTRNHQGKLICSYGALDTSTDIANEHLKQFHEQMIEKSQKAIREIDVALRSINAQTISINKSHLPRAKELIRKFQDDLSRLLESSTGDAVYQCNIQLFPLTKVNDKDNP